MYGLINALTNKGGKSNQSLSQIALSIEMGIDQSQISRWSHKKSTESFKAFAAALRRYTERNPIEWMQLLSDGVVREYVNEFHNTIFLTETFPYPNNIPIWVISSRPAEFDRQDVKQHIIDNLLTYKEGQPYIVYWLPHGSDSEHRIVRFIKTVLSKTGMTVDSLYKKLRVFFVPKPLCYISYAIFRPLTDERIGLISSKIDSADGIWAQVLPRRTTSSMVNELSYVYELLYEQNESQIKEEDGTEWRNYNYKSELK